MRTMLQFTILTFFLNSFASIDVMEHSISRSWRLHHSDIVQKTVAISDRTMAIRWWSEQPKNSSYYFSRVSLMDYDFNRVFNIVNETSGSSYYRTTVFDVNSSANQKRVNVAYESYYSNYVKAIDLSSFSELGSISFYNSKALKIISLPNSTKNVVYNMSNYQHKKIDKKHSANFLLVDLEQERKLHSITIDETGNMGSQAQVNHLGEIILLDDHGKKLKKWQPLNHGNTKQVKLGKVEVDRLLVSPINGDILISYDKKCTDTTCQKHEVKLKKYDSNLMHVHTFSKSVDPNFQISWKKNIIFNPSEAIAGTNSQDRIPTLELSTSEKIGKMKVRNSILSAPKTRWNLDKMIVAGLIGGTLEIEFLKTGKHHTFEIPIGQKKAISLDFEADGNALWIHYEKGAATRVIF